MSGQANSLTSIFFALGANFAIFVAKLAAALYTGSGAMLAEAIHSLADSGNQLLLIVGLRGAKRPPNDKHPLGYGKTIYFWSFIVALILFSMRGNRTLFTWFRESRKSELLVVFGEDLAALIGLTFALLAVGLAMYTGNPLFDALGSIVIGVLLIIIAVMIGIQVKRLFDRTGSRPRNSQGYSRFS
jgi:divalent metal cation (Fe/Co/Zn/Cd) transporter